MHTVGNNPRNHAIYASIEELFRLDARRCPPRISSLTTPAGITRSIGRVARRRTENSARDNYFARAMMYGSVLSGALAGHVHGTAAYDVTSTGEPAGWRPHIWTALRYESGAQMQHLRAFVLSEGDALSGAGARREGSRAAQHSRCARGRARWLVVSDAHGGEGFRARLFREQGAARRMQGIHARRVDIAWTWFDPRTGEWGARRSNSRRTPRV